MADTPTQQTLDQTVDSQNDAERPFETVLEELEQTVERLEKGNLPLADSLAAFERGMALVEAADGRLSQAEARVEALVRGPGGEDTTRPFADEYPDVELPPSGD